MSHNQPRPTLAANAVNRRGERVRSASTTHPTEPNPLHCCDGEASKVDNEAESTTKALGTAEAAGPGAAPTQRTREAGARVVASRPTRPVHGLLRTTVSMNSTSCPALSRS